MTDHASFKAVGGCSEAKPTIMQTCVALSLHARYALGISGILICTPVEFFGGSDDDASHQHSENSTFDVFV